MNYLKWCVAKFVSLNKTQDSRGNIADYFEYSPALYVQQYFSYQNELRIQVAQKKFNEYAVEASDLCSHMESSSSRVRPCVSAPLTLTDALQ
jgi:hypothetical protein